MCKCCFVQEGSSRNNQQKPLLELPSFIPPLFYSLNIFLTLEFEKFLQTLKALVPEAGIQTKPGSYPEWDVGDSTVWGEIFRTGNYKIMGYAL